MRLRGMSEPIFVPIRNPADAQLVDQHFRGGANWFMLIKDLRPAYDLSLYEAEEMALSHPGWRRWCNLRIKSDRACRMYAWRHLQAHGTASLVQQDDEQLTIG